MIAGAVCAALVAAAPARADNWYPHPSNAQWQYEWTDSTYNTAGTVEDVTVGSQNDPSGCGWTLQWSAPSASLTGLADSGTACFADQDFGLVNTDWSSTPPSADMPILCATASGCPNSLASALYNVIWGSRSPVLSEPVLQGTTWNSTGGASNEATSTSQLSGPPARQDAGISERRGRRGGSLADRARGYVRRRLRERHADHVVGVRGGAGQGGVRSRRWQRLERVPASGRTSRRSALPDQNYFPLTQGLTGTYKWTNTKHLRQPEVEKVAIDAVSNRSARDRRQERLRPDSAWSATYGFTVRLDGVRNIFGSTSAASLAKFPPLGHSRHFFTPVDLMTYGYNPLLPAYPVPGSSWNSGNPRDFEITASPERRPWSASAGCASRRGRFHALEVRSVLNQPGHPFGSGVRTMWLAPGRGLVKLVFQHRDGSTSVVELIG